MVTVRLAAPAEAVTLHAIAREAYQRYVPRIGREPAPMSADYGAAVRDGQAWVAVDQGQVIGFIVLIAEPGHLLLKNLAVRPSWQGGGAGSRLLALAEDEARRLRLDILGGQVQTIRSVSNPDKLGHVGPVADAWAVAREANRARPPAN